MTGTSCLGSIDATVNTQTMLYSAVNGRGTASEADIHSIDEDTLVRLHIIIHTLVGDAGGRRCAPYYSLDALFCVTSCAVFFNNNTFGANVNTKHAFTVLMRATPWCMQWPVVLFVGLSANTFNTRARLCVAL